MGTQDDNELKQYYLASWQEMLQEFLGWSPEKVLQWAQRFASYLDNTQDLFYHESPLYWAKHLLVPDSLRERLSSKEVTEIERAILQIGKDEYLEQLPTGTDWSSYRQKIDEVLANYGEKLPGPEGGKSAGL